MTVLFRAVGVIGLAVWLAGCVSSNSTKSEPESSGPRVTVSPLFNANAYDRVAIYVEELARSRLSDGALRLVEDEFMRATLEKGYTLASRSDIDSIKKELAIQSSNYSERALARKAYAINVSAIVLVSINEFSTERTDDRSLYDSVLEVIGTSAKNRQFYKTRTSISARMLSAELGQVVWLASHTETSLGDDRDGSETELPEVARIVASGLPVRIVRQNN